ncbi:MAG: endonuclease III [Fervidobacterium sp.]
MRKIDCNDINKQAIMIIKSFPRIHSQKDPFKVLIVTILSQRSKDENTEVAAKQLFEKYKDISEISKANPEDLYDLIKPAGLYKEKAQRIVLVANILLQKYKGKVPDNFEELIKLPGVGRKTANIVLYIGFGKEALAVDTHVHRISNRIGWVKTKTPEQTEEELKKILVPSLWGPINGSMVEFGKKVCKPISPKCESCFLNDCCQYFKSYKLSSKTTSLKKMPVL